MENITSTISLVENRVLLVEDNRIARKVAMLILEQLGCLVDTATTAAEAISMATTKKYALIFMDIGLPDQSGAVAAATICEKAKGQHPTIVALTAHRKEYLPSEISTSHFDAHIVKPLDPDTASQIISKYLTLD